MKVSLFDPLRAHAPLAEDLERAAVSVLRSGRYILGPEVQAFENDLSSYLGGLTVVGVSSGTDALVLALHSLGIGEGDEVITTPYSFVATAEAILRVGAEPVFVDVDPNQWMVDHEKVLEARTSRTKAVLPVHLFGAPFDPEPLNQLWDEGVFLIEDAAQALGATLKGQRVGSLGDASAFSFFPTKNLGGYGDGGAIAFKNEEVAQRAQRLRVHGRGLRPYESDETGYNSRLDALQAAFLNVKLAHLDRFNEARDAAASVYASRFKDSDSMDGLRLRWPISEPGTQHVFHQYVVEVAPAIRDELVSFLRESGVACAIYYPKGLHTQGFLGPYRHHPGSFPNAEAACQSTLALPIFPGITEEELNYVADQIAHFAAQKRNESMVALSV